MRVKDIMSTNVVKVDEKTLVGDARSLSENTSLQKIRLLKIEAG